MQMRNDFKNRENILGFMVGHGLAEHGERVLSELCKHGKPLPNFQKEKSWTDL